MVEPLNFKISECDKGKTIKGGVKLRHNQISGVLREGLWGPFPLRESWTYREIPGAVHKEKESHEDTVSKYPSASQE